MVWRWREEGGGQLVEWCALEMLGLLAGSRGEFPPTRRRHRAHAVAMYATVSGATTVETARLVEDHSPVDHLDTYRVERRPGESLDPTKRSQVPRLPVHHLRLRSQDGLVTQLPSGSGDRRPRGRYSGQHAALLRTVPTPDALQCSSRC